MHNVYRERDREREREREREVFGALIGLIGVLLAEAEVYDSRE